VEVPETKQVPSSWQFSSKRKGFKRYLNPVIKSLVTKLEKAETESEAAGLDMTRIVFEEFDKKRDEWAALVASCGELDCLLSLAHVSSESSCCTPTFLPESHPATLVMEKGIHPCVAAALEKSGKNSFIPNDVVLDETTGRLMLLTGPNSTFLLSTKPSNLSR
jgi:DNA mismatch repair ATPase MutS